MTGPQPRNQNNRPPRDFASGLVRFLAIGCWFLALAIVWTLSEAAPETVWGMDSFYGVSRSPRWNRELLSLAQTLTLALMMVTLLGLGVQSTQDNVGRGEVNKSLVAFAGVSIAGLVAFFLAA